MRTLVGCIMDPLKKMEFGFGVKEMAGYGRTPNYGLIFGLISQVVGFYLTAYVTESPLFGTTKIMTTPPGNYFIGLGNLYPHDTQSFSLG